MVAVGDRRSSGGRVARLELSTRVSEGGRRRSEEGFYKPADANSALLALLESVCVEPHGFLPTRVTRNISRQVMFLSSFSSAIIKFTLTPLFLNVPWFVMLCHNDHSPSNYLTAPWRASFRENGVFVNPRSHAPRPTTGPRRARRCRNRQTPWAYRAIDAWIPQR